MTIAIALKVGDGIVLGADSAATLGAVNKVFFNAEKISNLVKGLPLGLMVYGLGGLDRRSIASVVKDLRELLTNGDPHWRVGAKYTVEGVAKLVRQFIYEDRYQKQYPQQRLDAAGNTIPIFDSMGLVIAGFSADSDHPEAWSLQIDDKGQCAAAECVLKQDEFNAVWGGMPEALSRLMRGWSSQVRNGLIGLSIPAQEVDKFLQSLPMEPLVYAAMPLQDAIDLVKYMAEVTIGFTRFAPGPPTVAEPIDIAAITKHEGFRWVRRKHYYSAELNPRYRAGDALQGTIPASTVADPQPGDTNAV
ncbi:MAG: hypothetical protein ACJ79K_15535 [Gemmatimonadaceae bacterium]